MKYTTKVFFWFLIIWLSGTFSSQLFAQVPPPSNVPIDGGLALVFATCAAYGAKKLMDKKRK